MQTLFLQTEGCGNPVMIKSVSAIFLTALAYFMSVCHILVNSHNISKISLLLYLL